MKKRFPKESIVLLLLGICLGVMVTEAILFFLQQPRFYKLHSYPSQFSVWGVDNDYIIYRNSLSECIRFVYDGNPRKYFGAEDEIDHCTNSTGFRGREFETIKGASTVRIAFIGDSFTFGEGVKFKDTYPEKTAFFLQQKYKGLSVNFESYNFGVGGYNVADYLVMLKNTALDYNPDIVVIGYTLGDDEPPLFAQDKKARTIYRAPRGFEDAEWMNPSPPRKLIYKLRSARLLWQIIYNRKRSDKICNYYQSLYEEKEGAALISRAAFPRILDLCQAKGIPCYVLCFPLLFRLNDRHPFTQAYSTIKHIVEERNGIFIDLFPLLKGQDEKKLWVHPTDQHPNETVHRIAAKALAERMASEEKVNQIISYHAHH